jgi:hypothetical protein
VPARLLVVVAAIAVITVSFARLGDERRCRSAVNRIVGINFSARTVAIPNSVQDVRDHCHNTNDLVTASGALVIGHRPRPALELATVAVQREPKAFTSWAMLDVAHLAAGNRAAAAQAAARAQALNPRWQRPAGR